jgi:hypothetical protein
VPTLARRRLLSVGALAVVAIGLAWLTCSGTDVSDAPNPATAAASAAVPRVRNRPEQRPAPDAATSATVDANEASATAPPPEERLSADLFPRVRVEVAWPDGTPAVQARVYALPAASSGVDEGEDEGVPLPTASTDDKGACTLVVPAPGAYDVGALEKDFGFVLLTDVRIPEAGTVRLLLPQPEEVEFQLGPDVPRTESVSVSVGYVHDGSPSLVAFPGRGQMPSDDTTFAGDAASFPRRVRLPGGAALRASARAGERYLGARFVPPARVTFGADESRVVSGYFTFAPPELRWERRAWLDLEIDWGPNADPRLKRLHWSVRPGQPLADENWSTGAAVNADSGVIRWSGPGLEPGEAAWRLDPGVRRVHVPIVVRVADPSAIPRSPSFRVVRGAPVPEGAQVRRFVVSERAGPQWSDDAPLGQSFDVEACEFDPDWWAMAVCGDEVAGPVRGDPFDDRETTLDLRPGGWLVPEPLRLPPEQVGSVTLALSGGRPFFAATADDAPDPVTRCALRRDLVLGPLPPGRVEFTVRVGLRDVGTATGVVEAGKRTVLDLPEFAPAAR